MIPVSCPHCLGRLLLPAGLAGRGGARIRCPSCEREFVWRPAPPPAPDPGGGDPAPESGAVEARSAGAGTRDARAADEALAGLDPQALARAHASGELFARFGAELVRAFDRWRMARHGDAAGFRAALAARAGVELPAWIDA